MAWRWSRVLVAASLLVAGSVAGCGGSKAASPPASNAAPTTTPEEEEVSAGLYEHHAHHHYGGVTRLIAISLDTIGGEPQERAQIEKIRADLHARMDPARAAERALYAALAEGIVAGGIDHAKVDAAVAQVSSTSGGVADATADALDQLHAVLTPAQRAALVDKVEAHWQVWQAANAAEQRDAAGRPRRGGRLERLAREIGLTQDQQDKIHATLAASPAPPFDAQSVSAHIKAFGDAFQGDTFDAKALATSSAANQRLAGAGAARVARFYEAVDPVLTADQRTKLADILREHASYDPNAVGG